MPKIPSPFISSLKDRQPAAWGGLYDVYAPCVYGIIIQNAPKEVACMLLEDVFLALYKQIDEYRPEEERLFTWMYRFTINACRVAKNKCMPSAIPAHPADFGEAAFG